MSEAAAGRGIVSVGANLPCQPDRPARCGCTAAGKRLDQHGRVVVHYLTIPVSAKAIKAVGAGRVRDSRRPLPPGALLDALAASHPKELP